jgi:hypothetical protein
MNQATATTPFSWALKKRQLLDRRKNHKSSLLCKDGGEKAASREGDGLGFTVNEITNGTTPMS